MGKKIIIIGGGPGGYTAAIKGAKLGADVTLIENDKLGGTCLNYGCIPTKSLYKNAEVIKSIKNIDEFGVTLNGSYAINVDAIHDRKNNVVSNLTNGIKELLKKNNVEIIYGTASFDDDHTLKVKQNDGKTITKNWDSLIIATGSSPASLPIKGADLDGILTSTDILNFPKIYDNLTIVGGGVIGIEFAGIFNLLGSNVTIVEYEKNILAPLDKDVSKRLAAILKREGIIINTSSMVNKIEKDDSKYTVTFSNKKGENSIISDAVLISTGRKPRIDELNCDQVGINYDKKGIIVNEHFKTNIKNIYAIGDVNGISMLAHSASHQAVEVVENIMGIKSSHSNIVPGCIFSFPEAAFVGLTEKAAKEKNIEYKVGKFQFSANGKALTLGEGTGFVKVLTDMSDKLIGAQILGPHASDLIHECALAISNDLTVEDIKKTIHAHPTLSEAFYEAVLSVNGEAIHAL